MVSGVPGFNLIISHHITGTNLCSHSPVTQEQMKEPKNLQPRGLSFLFLFLPLPHIPSGEGKNEPRMAEAPTIH